MMIDKSLEYLFAQTGAKRWLNRPRLPRFNAILPKGYSDKPGPNPANYLYSGDRAALDITEDLAVRMTREFPMQVDEHGWAGSNAVPGDFYNLLAVSGYGMDPLSIPLMNNESFVKSLGIATNIRKEDIPWFQELVKLFFAHVTPENLHIRKKASSGFPYFTNDIQYRKMATLKCLHNIDDWLNALNGGASELERALNEYHSVIIYSVNERQQPPGVRFMGGKYSAKPRQAATPEEARSGSSTGQTFADMSVRGPDGRVIENHFAMRRRAVFGMSGVPNYVMTAILGSCRAVYLNRFSFTYKTRDAEDKERKIAPYEYLVGSDVKAMDTTVPTWFFNLLLEELEKYWDSRLVNVLRRMLFAPYVVPPPYIKTPSDYNPVYGRSPLDPTAFNVHVGLPSGIFINPDIGKLWMSFVYVILFRDSGALRFVSEIEPFLRGENKQHALLDSSDDATMLTNSAVVAQKLKAAKSPYAVLEPEVPVLYLGDVFCMDGGRKRAYPNPVTYLVNALVREDSIDRLDPVVHAEGVLARYQTYSRTPIFRDLNAIFEETCRKYAGINPYLIARSMAKRQKWSDVDAMVKSNPHYLHYRVDPKDVSPEVLDEIVATIPASDFFDNIKHLFKNQTYQTEDLDG